jgi:hypothetical protein
LGPGFEAYSTTTHVQLVEHWVGGLKMHVEPDDLWQSVLPVSRSSQLQYEPAPPSSASGSSSHDDIVAIAATGLAAMEMTAVLTASMSPNRSMTPFNVFTLYLHVIEKRERSVVSRVME